MQSWLAGGLELLFPIRCVGCGSPGSIWCSACDSQLERFAEPFCPKCGLALGAPRSCPVCRRRPARLPVRSYARYTGRLVQAVLHLKYRPDQKLAAVMGSWLAGLYPAQDWQATQVIPVPLSAARCQQRGFNQAELLARALAARLGLPAARGLRRVRDTRSQVGLDPAERADNVRGAFGADPGEFSGQVVLIVDDLYTTGATIAACAQAALAGGAVRAVGLTVGRA